MDSMKRLMCNFHYLGYYCSPNLFIHQNSTQELTWSFLVTLSIVASPLAFHAGGWASIPQQGKSSN
jgi:hypothetical protein